MLVTIIAKFINHEISPTSLNLMDVCFDRLNPTTAQSHSQMTPPIRTLGWLMYIMNDPG